ncbi:Glycerophosphoryl diester phosphodiesterase membrane domain-containing protein [Mycobacterium sp. smrl_JER01]
MAGYGAPPTWPPAGYGAPGYSPPGYGAPAPDYGAHGHRSGGYGYGGPGYGSVGSGPPGYGTPSYRPAGYGTPKYGAPGYPPYGPPPALKPGVVPLRPLSLSDMFNGAVAYIRANPKATLGLTTIVVVAAQLIALVLSLWPFAFTGRFAESLDSDQASTEVLVSWMASSLAAGITTALSTTLLSGLLTVVIGRSVFGAGITIGEAWRRLRPRLWALIGFTVLKTLGIIVWFGLVLLMVVLVVAVVDGPAAFLIAAPLVVASVLAAIWLLVMLTFVPAVIVLERRDILTSVKRSFGLIKSDFWRVFGIWLLAAIVAQFVAGAVSIPFSIGGQVALTASASTTAAMIAMVLFSVGGAVGQIITGPFSAGVVVLQYTDRRIRAEAFDLVLQTGAAAGPHAPADSTDDLWLTGAR